MVVDDRYHERDENYDREDKREPDRAFSEKHNEVKDVNHVREIISSTSYVICIVVSDGNC